MAGSERVSQAETRIEFLGVEVTSPGPNRKAARVELALSGADPYIGLAERELSDEADILCAANATARALEIYAGQMVELTIRSVFSLRQLEAIVVALNLKHSTTGETHKLIGSCLIRETAEKAAALAVLNASNRSLGTLLGAAHKLRFKSEQLEEQIQLHERLVIEMERNMELLARQMPPERYSNPEARALVDTWQFPEGSDGLLCTHDLDGRIIYGSPAAASVLGYEPEELTGMNMQDLVSPSTRHLFGEYLARITDNSRDEGLLFVVTKSGEERRWIYENVLSDGPDGSSYVIGRARDITELEKSGVISVKKAEE